MGEIKERSDTRRHRIRGRCECNRRRPDPSSEDLWFAGWLDRGGAARIQMIQRPATKP
jgi:hypothetical protein